MVNYLRSEKILLPLAIVLTLGCSSIIKADKRKGQAAEPEIEPTTEPAAADPDAGTSESDPVPTDEAFQNELAKTLAAHPEILVTPAVAKKIYGGVGHNLELYFTDQRAFDLLEKDWLAKVASYQFKSASLSKDFIKTANGSTLTTEQFVSPGVFYTSTEIIEGDTKSLSRGTNGSIETKSRTVCASGVCEFFSSTSPNFLFYKSAIESRTSKDGIETYESKSRPDESSSFIVNQLKTCRIVNTDECTSILAESRYVDDVKDTREVCHYDERGRKLDCATTVLPINGSAVINSTIKFRNVYTDDEKAAITTISRFKTIDDAAEANLGPRVEYHYMTYNGQYLARYGVTEGADQVKDHQCATDLKTKRVTCTFSKDSVISSTGATYLHKAESTYAILAQNHNGRLELFSLLTRFSSSDENDDFLITVDKNFTISAEGFPLTSSEFRQRFKKTSTGNLIELYSSDQSTYEYGPKGMLIAIRRITQSEKDGPLRQDANLWDFDDKGRLTAYKVTRDGVELELTNYSYGE